MQDSYPDTTFDSEDTTLVHNLVQGADLGQTKTNRRRRNTASFLTKRDRGRARASDGPVAGTDLAGMVCSASGTDGWCNLSFA